MSGPPRQLQNMNRFNQPPSFRSSNRPPPQRFRGNALPPQQSRDYHRPPNMLPPPTSQSWHSNPTQLNPESPQFSFSQSQPPPNFPSHPQHGPPPMGLQGYPPSESTSYPPPSSKTIGNFSLDSNSGFSAGQEPPGTQSFHARSAPPAHQPRPMHISSGHPPPEQSSGPPHQGIRHPHEGPGPQAFSLGQPPPSSVSHHQRPPPLNAPPGQHTRLPPPGMGPQGFATGPPPPVPQQLGPPNMGAQPYGFPAGPPPRPNTTCPPSAPPRMGLPGHLSGGPPPLPPHQFSAPPPGFPQVPNNFDNSRFQSPSHPTGQFSHDQVAALPQTDPTPQEKGKMILDDWLQNFKSKKIQKQSRSNLQETGPKLWEYTQQMAKMSQLLSEMSSNIEAMDKSQTTTDTLSWESSVKRLTDLKEKYIETQKKMPPVEKMETQLLKARKKRARLKRARRAKFLQNQELREQWALKSQRIDAWQERWTNKLKEENKKKARKAAADKTLSKVTKEIHDAIKLIDTMKALQKLRLVRRDAAEKRGDSNLGESREHFEQKITDMIRLVNGQLEFYKEEETRLKGIIKTEVEEINKKEKQSIEDKDRARQEEEDTKLKAMLFGDGDEKITPADPVFPFTHFYKQAEYSLDAFMNIRHQWDALVVPKETPEAKSLPSGWVVPVDPSGPVWASALK